MKVQVYAYDLTRGMAAAMSPMLLGYQIEAVWHTAVVIDARQEIFFGYGINKARAGATMFGQPARVLDMGETEVTPDVLEELLSDLAPRFRPQDYNLLFHNCNTFSNELVQLLTGESLPDYIMGQAEHLFNTPWGETLMPMVMAMEGFTGGATASGLAHQQQQPPSAAVAPAAPAPAAAATTTTAAAACSSAAAVQATTQAADQAASSTGRDAEMQAEAGGATAEPTTAAAAAAAESAAAANAAANAGMAAMARAQQQQQEAAASSRNGLGSAAATTDSAAAAASKAAEGVAGLSLTADSRAATSQQQ